MGVAVGRSELVLAEQIARLQVVAEEGVPAAVEDPHDLAAGPDGARVAVTLGELELALLEALAGLQVVGEEAVLAAV